MHAISSYRGNRPTNTQTTHTPTNTQTHRQDRLQYAAPLSLVRSVNILRKKTFRGCCVLLLVWCSGNALVLINKGTLRAVQLVDRLMTAM